MIAWEVFKYQGVEYDLTHLHPCRLQYIQLEKSGQPERTYTVEVCYSLHCFSKTLSIAADPRLNYSDARETRTFDLERYELSKQLPQIIQGLSSKRCMHTGKGNFFVVEVVTSSGAKEDYEVYFDVQNSSAKGVIARLFVQSAYVRDERHINRLATTKKISFFVILNNKQAGKPIRMPQ